MVSILPSTLHICTARFVFFSEREYISPVGSRSRQPGLTMAPVTRRLLDHSTILLYFGALSTTWHYFRFKLVPARLDNIEDRAEKQSHDVGYDRENHAENYIQRNAGAFGE
jgi:hypothetical protein